MKLLKRCKRIEFPINVYEFGKQSFILAETSEQFVIETPLISDVNAKFAIKSIPVNLPGANGEIYIFTYNDNMGEHWDQYYGVRTNYIESEPAATVPTVPEDLICLHGISLYSGGSSYRPYSMRLDYRNTNIKPYIVTG